MADPHLIFQDVDVDGDDIVAAARRYIGIRYSYKKTRIFEEDGVLRGSTDCLRLLLLVAKDTGLLLPEFDVNTARRPREPGVRPLDQSETVWAILRANFDEVPKKNALPGDVLLMIWKDVDRHLDGVHHVAIFTDLDPFPFGSMLHAIDSEMDGSGQVEESRIDANVWHNRIESAWRLKTKVVVE